MSTDINATDPKLAGVLSHIGSLDQGTLASAILRKRGVTRGPKHARVIYGNDFVHVLLWTGFYYKALVKRSHKKLHEFWDTGNLIKSIIKELQKESCRATVEDVSRAIQELDDGFLKVINGNGSKVESEETSNSVWRPLEVDGKIIRGSKVYRGPGNPSDPRAPVPGTIYLDGVKLGEKVLAAAPNGHWNAKSTPKTRAKGLLRSWLPIGLYVRYSLDPENLLSVKVGKEAGAHAKKEGVQVDPESIRSLFKIAP